MSTDFINIFNDVDIHEPTDEERYKACTTLWLEYRGSGTSIDASNINAAVKGFNRNRLKQFNLYVSLVKSIIDKENSTYINPPTRVFKTKTGKNISKNLREHIERLFDSMQYDTFMQKFETDAALLGTTLVRPMYIEADDTYALIELTPADRSLKVTPNTFIKSKPEVVAYSPTKEVKIAYDTENVTTVTTESGQEVTTVEPHGFKGQPFTTLNFHPDNSIFWGPFDGTLYSFTRQRSLILANAMVGMHLSEAERLVILGASWEEALHAIQDRMIVLPNTVDKDGNTIQPTVDTLKPAYNEVINQIENYLKLYHHILDVRGHQMRQFSVGADAMSAEAVRLGGIDMSQQIQKKRVILSAFEKELWKRVIWVNNSVSGNPTIPEDIELTLDWKADPYHFSSASDEVTFFTATMAVNVNTPVDWVRSRNPELSEEEAVQRLQDNTAFNDTLKDVELPVDETIVVDEEIDENNTSVTSDRNEDE